MFNIIALVGKSASGKSTILKRVLEKDKYHKIISCTTRPLRENEKDGIDYYFLSEQEFNNKIANNEMLEYTSFNNWRYGTSLSSLKEDKINIGIFNPQGILNLSKNSNINLKTYYIDVTDKERLIRSLEREKNPDIKEIIRRYQADEKDFEVLKELIYTTIPNNSYVNFEVIIKELF